MIQEIEVLGLLKEAGAVITNSHIVYTSGKHGSAYINKDLVYLHTKAISRLCLEIAEKFKCCDVDVVIGPTVGGVILSQWVAYHLSKLLEREVFSTYADKTRIKTNTSSGYENVVEIRHSFHLLLKGGNILVVDDILTTGGSVRKVIEAARSIGGNIVGLGVLCNRGNITKQDIGNIPELYALANIKLDSYDEAECPLCAKGVPINTDVGKGREFLALKSS